MNILDRVISFVSPQLGVRRLAYRERSRAYESASYGRRTKMFERATAAGPNWEISGALQTLRNRSREMVRNNGWAKRAIEAITGNVVGEGIRPAPQGTKNQVKKIKTLWKSWAESTACDWYGKNTFYGLQDLAMRSIAEGGDIIIIKRRVMPTKENPFPIKLQLLEGDQLDHYRDFSQFDSGSYCRLGVQFDKEGVLEGYWIYDIHPTDGTGFFKQVSSRFISKDDCIHVYELLRIGQVRGVPMGISSFIKIGDFSDYEDAQLLRQKIAACYTAFISGDDNPNATEATEKIEPGLIQYLKAGETITFGNPPPAENYSEYSKKILQGIAAAYGITYEMLTMDYSNVNFSSGRMAKIDISKSFRKLQYNMLVPQLCVPVWDWFMDACIIAGLTVTRVTCSSTDWTAPRVQQLDPTKETAARIAAIQAGLTSLSECLREDGRDRGEFLEEYAEDFNECKKYGLTLSCFATPKTDLVNSTEDISPPNNTSDGKKGN